MHSGRAAELGSKGGRRRTVHRPDGLKEFSAPKTAADLRDLLAQSIIEVRTGKLDPKLANSISYLGAGFLRAVELTDLETRLEDLERVMELGRATLVLGTSGNDDTSKNRIERLETEYRFRRWFHFQRFLEALTLEQLEAITARGHYPEPLPELPRGASRLDGLDRKSLMKLWQENERWHAQFRSRSTEDKEFFCVHGHWPEQACEERNCQGPRGGGAP